MKGQFSWEITARKFSACMITLLDFFHWLKKLEQRLIILTKFLRGLSLRTKGSILHLFMKQTDKKFHSKKCALKTYERGKENSQMLFTWMVSQTFTFWARDL